MGKKRKKCEKLKKILLFHHFTPEISDRGDLLPIPWTAYFRKFLPNSVNHDQDWMSIIFNPNMMNKLHPSVGAMRLHSRKCKIQMFLDRFFYHQSMFVPCPPAPPLWPPGPRPPGRAPGMSRCPPSSPPRPTWVSPPGTGFMLSLSQI